MVIGVTNIVLGHYKKYKIKIKAVDTPIRAVVSRTIYK